MQTRSAVQFTNIFRLGYRTEEADERLPDGFESLAVEKSEPDIILDKIQQIISASRNKLIELIIIPDRYMDDLEVMQTVQVREVAHQRKNGIGIVMTSTDAHKLLRANILPPELRKNIYKISTIRHGFEHEKVDENANLIIAFAKLCVAEPDSKLGEIVIRACHGAGYIRHEEIHPQTKEPLAYFNLSPQADEETESKSRAFLCGETGTADTSEYKALKQLSIRTQTITAKNAELVDPISSTNPLFAMRESLNEHTELRHLSVKAYYSVVNPVPENNPMRMGLWKRHERPANLSYPKAVRLISPDCNDEGEKPNHFIRPALT